MATHHIVDKSSGDMSERGDPIEIGYTKSDIPMRSPPMVDVDEDICYAKIVRTERENGLFFKYFVRSTLDNRLIDPWDDTNLKANMRHAKALGRDPYKFLEISKQGFDLYMLFLSGRSTANLSKASRELKYA